MYDLAWARNLIHLDISYVGLYNTTGLHCGWKNATQIEYGN